MCLVTSEASRRQVAWRIAGTGDACTHVGGLLGCMEGLAVFSPVLGDVVRPRDVGGVFGLVEGLSVRPVNCDVLCDKVTPPVVGLLEESCWDWRWVHTWVQCWGGWMRRAVVSLALGNVVRGETVSPPDQAWKVSLGAG
jgi:hypothetical protein